MGARGPWGHARLHQNVRGSLHDCGRAERRALHLARQPVREQQLRGGKSSAELGPRLVIEIHPRTI